MINKKDISEKLNIKYWLKFSIINLLLVGLIGVLMRYKIGFEFPYFNQKYLQEAHSHFAFIGWISHTLYVLMINFIQDKIPDTTLKNYRLLLVANLLCAYGMLISFIIDGYGIFTICLTTGAIIIACFYTYFFIKDLKKIIYYYPATAWFKAALWFNIISSIGTFYLVYMMVSRNFDEHWYLAAVYFFLHFSYNGFFVFACLGLVHTHIQKVLPSFKHDKTIFRMFFSSVIPAYFLSTLWANLPSWLYVIVIIAAFVQVLAWIKFLNNIRKAIPSKINLTKIMQNLFLFVAIAFSIKIILQLGSTIPMLAKLAYGFRPIVIAYLHLVLLAVITVFLLSFMYSFKFMRENQLNHIGMVLFVIGIFLNELVLAIQGIASFSYFPIPLANEILFFISLILLTALVLLVISQIKFKPYVQVKSKKDLV